MTKAESLNMRLIAQDRLAGFGGIGEGMSLQLAAGNRRILWLAHESAPKNFTAVDVTDPGKPRVIVQTELPHRNVRSNSLEVCGNLMAVAYQTSTHGQTPAGIEIFDISTPEEPRSISFFDCSGPKSRGVHQLWFVDGKTIHFAGGAADFSPRNLLDDQCYRAIDVSDPAKPRELGRWWYPGTADGDDAPPPPRHPKFDSGFRAHNTNVYPERPDRAYVGYLDGGAVVLDIADIGAPKQVGHWNPHPPFPGFTHTVMPIPERDLLVVSDECVRNDGEDWPKLVWLLDARLESNLVCIGTLPLPSVEEYAYRGGRYGAHNMHENRPGPAFRSSSLVFGTYFNGGLRVHDISDPFQPKEVAYYVPEPPEGSRVPSVQINDVYVDENRTIYAVDRFAGGLYTLELTL
ncbi:MAG TPA: hypothetical protein VH023_10645 [Rhodopila sp.]|jgi:hypothetical protein|nr:hypothetical protein [Rhodopila sp.]